MIYLDIAAATASSNKKEIETLEASTDVADVVATKADLDSYDTSQLTDNAVVKVLIDSSQNNAQSYYRYSLADDSFTLIGSIGPYVMTTSTASQVYATNNNGVQTTLTYSNSASNSTIVQRTSSQQVRVATNPMDNNDATSKKYVDDGLNSKVNNVTITSINTPTASITLNKNTIFNCISDLTSLTLTLPATIDIDYSSQINFTAGQDWTGLTAPSSIMWHGCDVDIDEEESGDIVLNNAGTFTPISGTRYILKFFYDGTNVHCDVFGTAD